MPGGVLGPKLPPRAPAGAYFVFLDEAETAFALLEAFVFFSFLTAESCFLALSLAFGDLSPI
jgi:hypothetical protein